MYKPLFLNPRNLSSAEIQEGSPIYTTESGNYLSGGSGTPLSRNHRHAPPGFYRAVCTPQASASRGPASSKSLFCGSPLHSTQCIRGHLRVLSWWNPRAVSVSPELSHPVPPKVAMNETLQPWDSPPMNIPLGSYITPACLDPPLRQMAPHVGLAASPQAHCKHLLQAEMQPRQNSSETEDSSGCKTRSLRSCPPDVMACGLAGRSRQ